MRSVLAQLLSLACFSLCLAWTAPVNAQREVLVTSAAELRSAVESANPGDELILADGTYDLTGSIRTRAAGTEALPITVRPENRGGALLRWDSDGGFVEGFIAGHDHWRFVGLRMEGVCSDDSRCEHAFHVVAADAVVIRGVEAFNFNAHIKANGNGDGLFPDDALIDGNHFYNTAPRMTSNPVTPIDVVGGRRWTIRGNYIHDFQKGQGDTISYALFLKGTHRDGVIERNLIVCAQEFSGGVRVGASFGGGGTGPDPVCDGGDCSIEAIRGVMRNNVIAHCSDVGIYVNECQDCVVAHNTLYDTAGIDYRFGVTSVRSIGNLSGARVRDRDGAMSSRMDDLVVTDAQLDAMFRDPSGVDFALVEGAMLVDQASAITEVSDDFCGNTRDGNHDIGAVEFDGDGPCDTTMPSTTPPVGMDAGPGDAGPDDAGPDDAGPDAGTDAGADGGTDAGTDTSVDSGLTDVGSVDGSLDTGTPTDTSDTFGPLADDGCGCSVPGSRAPRPLGVPLGLFLLGALVAVRFRR